MNKIFIDNEEVLCDSSYKIEEELKNPSSVILDKVYPKRWKGTNKLLTDFYFPKDYSKCLIKNVTDIPAEEGEYAAGTNLNINVDNTKEWNYQLKGNIEQNNYSGINLMPNNKVSGTSYGVTFTPNEDGTYSVNGKNNNSNFNSHLYIYNGDLTLEPGKYYYITTKDANCGITMYVTYEDGTKQYIDMYNGTSQTFNKKVVSSGIYLQVRKGTTTSYNNFILYPMLSTTPVTKENYEPYVGGNKSPSPDYPQNIKVATGEQNIIISQNENSQNCLINLGNIELYKIGTYKDYIYNQNGDWYLHKETGTYNLNNSRITLRSNYTNIEYAIFPKATDFIGYDNYKGYQMYSSHAEVPITYSSWNDKNNINKLFSGAEKYTWWLGFEKGTGLDNIKAKLTNVVIIYPLATPTDIKITDTNLIQQLDNLKNTTLFNGVNNISVSGNLPSILDLHYNYVTARTDEELIFAGIVKNSGNMVLNPRKPHYCSLQILDYSTLLSESDTLDYVINNKTIPEAIEQVIDSISSYGFVIGNINIKDTTSIIGAYSTLDKTPYDVFEYLSEISQSVWFTRMIDENTIAIDFYDVDYLPQNDDIEYTREYFDENKINNIEYDYSTNDYRNKQIIKSSQVYGNVDYVETIIASGYDKTFNTSENIGVINSIKVNGVDRTIGTNADKEIGLDADFYYSVGMNIFESNENSPTYSAGTTIVITYTPLIKGRSLAINNSEVSRINNQIQRRGTITRYENRDDILSAEELNKVAQSYIKTYSNSEISLKLNSSKNFLNIGSKIFFNAPLEELKKEYLVKKKTAIIKQGGDFSLIKYQYELSSTFNLNNEINYFDNQRRKSEGNISTGENIDRNIDVENTANVIFYDLEVGVSQ